MPFLNFAFNISDDSGRVVTIHYGIGVYTIHVFFFLQVSYGTTVRGVQGIITIRNVKAVVQAAVDWLRGRRCGEKVVIF